MVPQFPSSLRPNSLDSPPFSSDHWPSHSPQQLHRLEISPSPSGYAASAATTFADLREAPPQSMSTIDEAYTAAVKPFPERPNEPDCGYYIRTGQCAFGMDCKFNHPPNRNLINATLGTNMAGYPERIGQPECQYYMKTGTCKFGSICKFHHPREKLGMLTTNLFGFPLRQGEKDCPYYMRTGSCKFGATCIFNHPQPAALMTVPGSSVYPSNTSPGAPSPQPFPTGMPSWPLPRGQFMPRSRFQNTANFTPLIMQPQNVVSVSGWSPYQGQLASLDAQSSVGRTNLTYGATSVNEASPAGRIHTTYNNHAPGSTTAGIPSATLSTVVSKVNSFPERPGQQNCPFYMKTGGCKFGMTCRFNHPKERVSLLPHCTLNPLGFPIRQGAPPCVFYMQHGTCKFGATCKFDHPITDVTSSIATSSVTNIHTSPFPMGMSVAILPSTNNGPRMTYHKIVANGDIDNQQQIYDHSYVVSIGEESNEIQTGAGSSNILSGTRDLKMGVHESGEALNAS